MAILDKWQIAYIFMHNFQYITL